MDEQRVLQRRLAKFLVDDVFNTVAIEDILQIAGKKWMHRGKELSEAQVKTHISQAKVFQTGLWPLLKNELVWHAQQKAVLKSETEADLIASKLLIYLIKVIDRRLKLMTGESLTKEEENITI